MYAVNDLWMFPLSAVRQRFVRRKAEVLRHAGSEPICATAEGVDALLTVARAYVRRDASLPNA
jgi:hypothetical protein